MTNQVSFDPVAGRMAASEADFLREEPDECYSLGRMLPELDLEHLTSFVALDANQTQQVKAYRRSLRAQG